MDRHRLYPEVPLFLVTPSFDSIRPVRFTYTISDGNGAYDSASVVVTVNNTSAGHSPIGTSWTDPNFGIEMIRLVRVLL